jgi:hypothetical protein
MSTYEITFRGLKLKSGKLVYEILSIKDFGFAMGLEIKGSDSNFSL